MWQALEPNPTDDVDAETIAREARNVQGIPPWLAQMEAKSGNQKSIAALLCFPHRLVHVEANLETSGVDRNGATTEASSAACFVLG